MIVAKTAAPQPRRHHLTHTSNSLQFDRIHHHHSPGSNAIGSREDSTAGSIAPTYRGMGSSVRQDAGRRCLLD